MQSRSLMVTLTAVLLQFWSSGVFGADLDDGQFIDRIIERAQADEALFFDGDNYLIEYSRESSQTLNPAEKGILLLVETSVGRFQHHWRTTRKEFEIQAGTKSYGRSSVCVVRGDKLVEYNVSHGSAVVDNTELGRNLYSDLMLFRNLSIDGPGNVARSLGLEGRLSEIRREFAEYADLPFLPQYLQDNRAHYRSLPDRQAIGDFLQCRVLEYPGKDMLWVDCETFRVVRRRYSWNRQDCHRVELEHRDFREVRPNLFVPHRTTETLYFDPIAWERKELANVPRFRAEYRLERIAFGSLQEKDFDIALPEGTTVFDAPRNVTYVASRSGGDVLDSTIGTASQQLQNNNERKSNRWILLINIAAVLTILAVALVRRYISTKRQQ